MKTLETPCLEPPPRRVRELEPARMIFPHPWGVMLGPVDVARETNLMLSAQLVRPPEIIEIGDRPCNESSQTHRIRLTLCGAYNVVGTHPHRAVRLVNMSLLVRVPRHMYLGRPPDWRIRTYDFPEPETHVRSGKFLFTRLQV